MRASLTGELAQAVIGIVALAVIAFGAQAAASVRVEVPWAVPGSIVLDDTNSVIDDGAWPNTSFTRLTS
jgi:hypothetical protein